MWDGGVAGGDGDGSDDIWVTVGCHTWMPNTKSKRKNMNDTDRKHHSITIGALDAAYRTHDNNKMFAIMHTAAESSANKNNHKNANSEHVKHVAIWLNSY